jgi:hypothetical protein
VFYVLFYWPILIVHRDFIVIFPYMHIVCFDQIHLLCSSFLSPLSPFKQFLVGFIMDTLNKTLWISLETQLVIIVPSCYQRCRQKSTSKGSTWIIVLGGNLTVRSVGLHKYGFNDIITMWKFNSVFFFKYLLWGCTYKTFVHTHIHWSGSTFRVGGRA